MSQLGFWSFAQREPEKLALVADGREWTRGELLAEANRIAHGLRALGLEKGDAVAVRVDDLVERTRPERLDIRATIFVEQDSQKGILIGKGGAMLKRIGSEARRELERFFGIQVFLGLTVAVRRNWRRDPRALREFGFMLTS